MNAIKSRVVRFTRTGGPQVLKIEEVWVRQPGFNEVRIAVKALGLNRADMMWRRGRYIEVTDLPAHIGYEASGVVESLGEGVVDLAVGDAVSVIPGFSLNEYGMHGEWVLAPANMVIKIPACLTFEEAASIWMMFLTAYDAIIEPVRPSVGTTVLIPDAGSAEGIAAIQIVNAIDAIPVAITCSKGLHKKLLDAGAAYAVETEREDWISRFQHASSGSKSMVFDPFFAPALPPFLDALSVRAQGLDDTAMSTRSIEGLVRLPTIFGYPMWGVTSDAQRLKAATEFILAGFTTGCFTPVIDRVFSFDEIVDAHRCLDANEPFGKIIVTL
ncbi:zinc-dependent alcohol dehydrogenase family protein [Pseudomonas gingeri]|uniref:Zinc-dependent alcohol dehydrogenase family protein n=1 Tax=Pseudomonas gingeri TaxID=117681 RepID=A0A7Y7XI27_9PSED|nr:zinc-dependent alcohol dehydrogenase family protein [Pseudomonas gingeri]NWC00030.1 zinc-dependent alcohol dehydrogenase family protein [Pseudomonas gingeri]